ncbi:UNVERIFIED_CONTAM: hypothetical protein GTU68_008596 [Idotea baltica]|nr:hypothetical protein [Idotea baltica]
MANLLANNGHEVLHWMRDAMQVKTIKETRHNARYLKNILIHENVIPTTNLQKAVESCRIIFVALPSSALRQVLEPIKEQLVNKLLISTTKGIEENTFKLMSQILLEMAPLSRIAVLSGPNFAKEIANKQLTASVIGSKDDELTKEIQSLLHSPVFRPYTSDDPLGVELGGALKNVYAIMAGMACALNFGENTRGMLITRALSEMTRFAVSLGANPITFLGLSGVGDLLVTCSSANSRNYQVGYALGQGISLSEAVSRLGEVAEGVNTVKVLHTKAQELNIYMPLVQGLYAILFDGFSLQQVLHKLMTSETKVEADFLLN